MQEKLCQNYKLLSSYLNASSSLSAWPDICKKCRYSYFLNGFLKCRIDGKGDYQSYSIIDDKG